MGQKTNPIVLRIGITRMWESSWFVRSKAVFAAFVYQDRQLRKLFIKHLKKAGISRIIIERPHKKCHITLHAARPGYVIGKKGEDIEKLKKLAQNIVGGEVQINIVEVKTPETDAVLIADTISQSLERRIPHRRAAKKAIQAAMRAGAKGICIDLAGRLGGAEIARREVYAEGSVPRHKLKAIIDYGAAQAMTTYGVCGVKVWLYKGDVADGHLLTSSDRRRQDGRQDSSDHRKPKQNPENNSEIKEGEDAAA